MDPESEQPYFLRAAIYDADGAIIPKVRLLKSK